MVSLESIATTTPTMPLTAFDVHCDETSIHAHVQTVPVEQVRKRGRVGSKYIHKDKPENVLSTK